MAFVMSGGQIARLQTGPPAGWSSIPTTLQLSSTQHLTYAEIWRTQPAVRTVIGFIARNIAQLGLDVYEKSADGLDRRKTTKHPLAAALNNPVPGSNWNRYRLINWTVHELCVYDTAYWIKGQVGGKRSLIPMPRRYIDPIGDNPLYVEKYKITGSKGERIIDASEVVHLHGYNPDDLRTGVSPLETLRQVLAEEYAASQYREQMWRNGGRMSGVIERSEKAPRWSGEARDRFATEWRSLYGEGGSDAGGTAILEDGMTYKPTGITPRDAQYVESRRLTREEVAIAFYLNPMMLGISEGGAGGWKEMHTQLYQDGLGPWLAMLTQDIETQLLLDLDPGAVDGSVYLEFNIQAKLAGSFEEQAAVLNASTGAPWMSRSEARARFNLPHLPEADDLIVPLNVTKGGLASPRDTAPDNPSNAESNGQLPGPKPPQLGGAPSQDGQ